MPAQDTLLSRMLSTRSGLRTAALLVLAGTSPAAGAVSPEAAGAGEWRAWGGSPGGIRFSALRQIDRVNVARLEPAWTYRTGELLLGLAHSPWRASFNATPLVVRGMLYLSTPSSRVIALEPETGKEAWSFDPQKDKAVREFNAHRGVAYWEAGGGAAGARACERRILSGTVDGRLLALDAATGKPCADFGTGGAVDLREELHGRWPQDASWGTVRITAPPVVFRDLVITGVAQQEFPGRGPYGDVRAFDVRTGREAWRFHTVPRPGEAGHDTWAGDSWRDRMGVNVWPIMSVDVERGMVFLPIGSPAADFYGGDRHGANLYGNSLVALDAATGRYLWHFQMVHHDLWDYDLPAQPVLFMFRGDGREAPAVAQVTKMGFVYVLDRLTGKPLFPVEERPVPASDVPGEVAWPTQPVPTAPPPLVPQRLDPVDLYALSPEHLAACRERLATLRNDGLFTPPSLRGSVVYPFTGGGANWSGASLEPGRGLLVVPVQNLERTTGGGGDVHPISGLALSNLWWVLTGRGTGDRYRIHPLHGRVVFRHDGVPCNRPPWGRLVAVDLARGEIAWTASTSTREGDPGSSGYGPALVTASGLVFQGGTREPVLRVHDIRTGARIATFDLPAGLHAGPITYKLAAGHKQFLVVAPGGHPVVGSPVGDAVIAYTLP
ncbi:MAG: pyrroloquinoline quinone-dependent dehydrogenase [Deltaproteobacteria bacterium]|nr:MAG: pyrroloquinoline quinone-dependent dehydrogenase [Deltaproteobacteria bacterium]